MREEMTVWKKNLLFLFYYIFKRKQGGAPHPTVGVPSLSLLPPVAGRGATPKILNAGEKHETEMPIF